MPTFIESEDSDDHNSLEKVMKLYAKEYGYKYSKIESENYTVHRIYTRKGWINSILASVDSEDIEFTNSSVIILTISATTEVGSSLSTKIERYCRKTLVICKYQPDIEKELRVFDREVIEDNSWDDEE